MYLENEAK